MDFIQIGNMQHATYGMFLALMEDDGDPDACFALDALAEMADFDNGARWAIDGAMAMTAVWKE